MAISEIDIELKKREIAFHNQLQYAIKIIINSIYGAFGNKYFYFYNRDIAQSITLQGQDLILFSMSAINMFFREKWHLDKELHQKLGIGHLKVNQITADASLYADTDSTYCNFSLAIESVEGLDITPEEKILFCRDIVDYRFGDFLDNAFKVYAEAYHVDNYMNFKLESISYNGIWVAKKNYTINVGYENFLFDKPHNITKGLENKKPSHPRFARKILDELIGIISMHNGKISLENDIIPILKKYQKLIEVTDIDEISSVKYVRTYNDYVKDDTNINYISDGMPINARAALYYNHFRDKGKYYKYFKIKQGDQIRIYYAKHNDPKLNIFAYIPKQFPIEFAFPVDYNEQFFKTVVEPLNRLLTAMDYFKIDRKLSVDIPINVASTAATKKKKVEKIFIINEQTLETVEIPDTLKDVFLKKREPTSQEYAIYESYIYKFGVHTEIITDVQLSIYIDQKKKGAVRVSVRKWLETLP